jgi:hypothetical protein
MNKNTKLVKPVFIVGLHRTGSTFLKNILNASSSVAMATDEMHLSSPWRKTIEDDIRRFGDLQEDVNLDAFMDYLYSGKPYGTFWLDYPGLGIPETTVTERVKESDRSLRSIISIILDEYRLKEGKARVGVKYPVHFSRIKMLRNWFPDSKIVFLTRDARAICASKLSDEATKRRKSQGLIRCFFIHYATLLFFVIEYIWSSRIYRKWREDLRIYLVRYEDLANDPKAVISDLCTFCNIQQSEEMLSVTGKVSSFNKKKHKGAHKDSMNKWKTQLCSFDKWLITVLTKRSMRRFGY